MQVDGGDGVDVVFGGFGDDFDLGVAGGEGHTEEGDAGGPEAGGAVGIAADVAAPLHPKDGAIDGAGGKVVGAGLLDGGGGPLGFAPDGGGHGEGDGSEGGREPEDGEQRAAALGFSRHTS